MTTNISTPRTDSASQGQVTTHPPVDRKYVQKVKAAHEQRERTLARVIITALATCGTLVGWMLFARPDAVPAQSPMPAPMPATDPSVPIPPTAVVRVVSSDPIPTVVPLPTFMPIPTLMTVHGTDAAPAVAVVVAPTSPDAPPGVVDAMPALRVVTMPTAMPMRPPRPGQPDPAPPNPAGNTGGSK